MFSAVTRLLSLVHFFFIFFFWGGVVSRSERQSHLFLAFVTTWEERWQVVEPSVSLILNEDTFCCGLTAVTIALISNLDPAAVQYLIIFFSTLVCSILVFLCLLPRQYKYQGEIFILLLYVSLLLGIKGHKICFISCQQNCIRHHTWNWEV